MFEIFKEFIQKFKERYEVDKAALTYEKIYENFLRENLDKVERIQSTKRNFSIYFPLSSILIAFLNYASEKELGKDVIKVFDYEYKTERIKKYREILNKLMNEISYNGLIDYLKNEGIIRYFSLFTRQRNVSKEGIRRLLQTLTYSAYSSLLLIKECYMSNKDEIEQDILYTKSLSIDALISSGVIIGRENGKYKIDKEVVKRIYSKISKTYKFLDEEI